MAKDDPYFRLRIPEKLKQQIEKAAAASNRSATAEILSRLERSFEFDSTWEDTVTDLYTRLEKLERTVDGHDEALNPGRHDHD